MVLSQVKVIFFVDCSLLPKMTRFGHAELLGLWSFLSKIFTHTQGLPSVSSHLPADSISLWPSDRELGKSPLLGGHPVKGFILRRGLEMGSRLCGVSEVGQWGRFSAPFWMPFQLHINQDERDYICKWCTAVHKYLRRSGKEDWHGETCFVRFYKCLWNKRSESVFFTLKYQYCKVEWEAEKQK